MTTNFSPDTFNILNFSKEEASRLHCGSVSPLHLLLGIIRHTDNKASQLLAYYLPDGVSQLKSQLEMTARQHQVLISPTPADMNFDTQANRIMRLCKLEASLMKSETIEPIHVLLAILKANDNEASDILQRLDITYEKVNSQQATNNNQWSGDGMDDDDEDMEPVSAGLEGNMIQVRQQKKQESKTPALDNFGTDLTYMAANDLLDPVVGREKEIERVAQILNRRKKNNPILIGEPGVGKSAIVEGLAQRIVAHRVSRTLWNKRIVVLDLASVVAGTKYRGQFEERLRCIIKELQQNPEVIVFIDEIHTLVGAGNAAGSMDAANMLKPALSRGEFQCIGSTTLDEFRKTIEKDGALERRFQKIVVNPTTEEETLQILRNIKDRYESHHRVTYSNEAIEACVKLTGRYIGDRQFPDKAIDALDETGAHMRLANAVMPPSIAEKEKAIAFVKEKKQDAVRNQNFELAASFRDRQLQLESELDKLNKQWQEGDNDNRPVISADDVAAVISLSTGIPVGELNTTETLRLKHLDSELKQSVIAQDNAVDTLVRAIRRNRIGLRNPNRPVGVFMFLGPTGVGKTYLAKRLAQRLFSTDDALIRIDLLYCIAR